MFSTILNVLALMVGLLGLYPIIKNRKKRISLLFGPKSCYQLVHKDIDKLKVKINYKDRTIGSSIILFKGVLINDGRDDIDESSLHSPVIIKSSKEFMWLETNVLTIPKNSKVKINNLDSNNVEIEWDLLKSNECIEFEALVEVSQSCEKSDFVEQFYRSLHFDFRITNLKAIEKMKDINLINIKYYKWLKFLLIGGMLGCFYGFFALWFTSGLMVNRVVDYFSAQPTFSYIIGGAYLVLGIRILFTFRKGLIKIMTNKVK